MRILFISNLYPPFSIGGYEQICSDIAIRLQNLGHDVHVLTSSFRAQEIGHREPGVYRRLKLRSSWIWPPQARATAVGRNRVEVDWHNFRTFRRVADTVEPDVVMFWNGGHLGPAILWGAEDRGSVLYYLSDAWLAPTLARQQADTDRSIRRQLYHRVLSAVTVPNHAIQADRLIFCSRALQTQYAQMGADVSAGAVIYHGISCEEFPLRPQHILARQPGEPWRILYSGRISPDKGVTTLVMALARLRTLPEMERTRLSLLGTIHSEAYEAQLRSQIRELELADAVDFLAHRPRSELPDVYSEHDVMAFTSEWEEPFALTLLHGMAVGIPVISTLRGGSADIVRDGENAIAFAAGDADDLARKLMWTLTHPKEAAAIGRAASAEVRRKYTLESQVSAVEARLAAAAGE